MVVGRRDGAKEGDHGVEVHVKLFSFLSGIPGFRTLAGLYSASLYRVQGSSMEPNYANGHHFVIDRSAFRRRPPQRGQVIVFTHPSLDGEAMLKRVVGLPAEKVGLAMGRVFIDGKLLDYPHSPTQQEDNHLWDLEWHLNRDEFFVLGDNRSDSLDSRKLGPIRKVWIIGKVWFRYWPVFG